MRLRPFIAFYSVSCAQREPRGQCRRERTFTERREAENIYDISVAKTRSGSILERFLAHNEFFFSTTFKHGLHRKRSPLSKPKELQFDQFECQH